MRYVCGFLVCVSVIGCGQHDDTSVDSARPNTVDTNDRQSIVRRELPDGFRELYTVERDEISREGIHPYIIRRISIAKSITASQLRDVLQFELDQTRQLDYGPMPGNRCAFTVLAFTEPENARTFAGSPVAKITLFRNKTKPEIQISDGVLDAIKERPQEKFGLDESTRRTIYRELVAANLECSDLADQLLPAISQRRVSDQELKHRNEKFNELWERRQNEIARKYGVSRVNLRDMESEGSNKHWPQPPN